MAELAIPLILIFSGVLFIILEIFLPSGGMLGLLAAGLIGGSIWQAFQIGTQTGMLFLLAAIIIVPVAVMAGLALMPKTPLGKRMILANKPSTPAAAGKPGVDTLDLQRLTGMTGKAISDLRPAGVALIDGRRHGVTARDYISSGSAIVVSRVEGNSIIVKLADAQPAV